MSWETVETVRIPNGEGIAYRKREGGEVPVLLLHGNLSSSRHWDLLFEHMDDRFALYAMDLRGFGDSSYENEFDSLKALADDVVQFMNAIDLERTSLLGWSAGGGVAMQVAADVPDRIDRLALLSPPSTQGLPVYRKDEDLQPTDEVLTTREELRADPVSVAPALQAIEDGDAAAMTEIWRQAIFVNDEPEADRFEAYVEASLQERCLLDIDYALVHFNISTEDNAVEPGTGEVDRITAPTLVLRGEDDLVVPEALVRRAAADIEDAELVELPGCGHAPTVDDLDLLLSHLEPFLDPE